MDRGAWWATVMGLQRARETVSDQHFFSFFSRNYLVALPAHLKFPSTQRVCLDLSPGYNNVKFTVTLETKGKTHTLLQQFGLKTRHLHCSSFLVSTGLAQLSSSVFLFSSMDALYTRRSCPARVAEQWIIMESILFMSLFSY